jgi:hypothetical protein
MGELPGRADRLYALVRAAPALELLREPEGKYFRAPRKNGDGVKVPHGTIVALILLTPLEIRSKFGEFVGLGGSFKLVARFLEEVGISVSEQKLRRLWKRYRGVAHLWAAWYLCDAPSVFDVAAVLGLSPWQFYDFSAVAGEIAAAAETHYHKQSRRPLLSAAETAAAWAFRPPPVDPLELSDMVELPPNWREIVAGGELRPSPSTSTPHWISELPAQWRERLGYD